MPKVENELQTINRYKGTLVGAAAGDALGAPVEFLSPRQVQIQFAQPEMIGGGIFKWKKGEFTDDTDLTLAIVDSLVENRKYIPQDIARKMVIWYQKGPKDVGPTTAHSLNLIIQGYSFKNSGKIALQLKKAGPGNGSLMRTAPIGLYFRNKPEDIDKAAAGISAITHAHPDCIVACQIASHLVSLLATGYSKQDSIRILKEMYPNNTQAGYKLRKALDGETQYARQVGHVLDTLTIALTSFIESENFESAVTKAIHAGWDTDTQATTAGAFAGAFFGNEQIPKRWKERINPVSTGELEKKAEKLYYLNKMLPVK